MGCNYVLLGLVPCYRCLENDETLVMFKFLLFVLFLTFSNLSFATQHAFATIENVPLVGELTCPTDVACDVRQQILAALPNNTCNILVPSTLLPASGCVSIMYREQSCDQMLHYGFVCNLSGTPYIAGCSPGQAVVIFGISPLNQGCFDDLPSLAPGSAGASAKAGYGIFAIAEGQCDAGLVFSGGTCVYVNNDAAATVAKDAALAQASCSSPTGKNPDRSYIHFTSKVAKMTPSGPVSEFTLPLYSVPPGQFNLPTVCYQDGKVPPHMCEYKFVNKAPFIYDVSFEEGVTVGVGTSIDYLGLFLNTGKTCSTATPGASKLPQGADPLTSPRSPPYTKSPPTGCPTGYHNNNDPVVPECIENAFTCPTGQHVVQFGQSFTGGTMETCVADTSSTGSQGMPPAANGSCLSPLVNVNGICNLSSTFPEPIPYSPLSSIKCVEPFVNVGGVCVVLPNYQVPSTGFCFAPLVNENGLCVTVQNPLTLPPVTTNQSTVAGSTTAAGQCGGPGFPACKTDVGELLNSTSASAVEPTARTSAEIQAELSPSKYPLLSSIISWQLPVHTSTCDMGSFTNIDDKEVSFKPICDTFDLYKPQMSTFFLWLWAVLPFFMVIRS